MKYLKLLSRISLSFQNLDNFNQQMNTTLKDIGNCMDVSRIYIFFYEDSQILSNTFEWCNEGITCQIQNLQQVNFEDIKSFEKILKEKGRLCSNDILELPKDIVDVLLPQQIKSLLIYPLIIEKEMKGFIGFDECSYNRVWKAEEIEVLRTISGIVSNAYERKFSHQNLIASEINFRNFFETIEYMFLVSDLEGRIIHCNKAMITKLGYSLEELQSMSILDLHTQDDREEASKVLNDIIKGEVDNCSLKVKSKTDYLYTVETRVWFGKWNNCDCIYSISVSDEVLKESEKSFFLALDKTEAGFWDFNIVKNEVFLSPMWKKILGYEEDEIENSFEAWQELWHPDDRDNIENTIEDYLSGKKDNYRNIHRLRHKNGEWRWILGRGGVLRDNKGSPYRWIGTNTDITTEHEQALELERVFSINLDLLCILDLEGYFLKTNKAWEDVLGYSEFKFKGYKVIDFIHEDDISITNQAMEKLNKGITVDRFINRYRNINGNYHYMEWRAKPYEGLIYAAARDITDRIEYENKILDISNRDALTNVYNRRYVFNKAEQIIKEYKNTHKVFSVCILDIDYFKIINDTYGHQIGDNILKELTKTIGDNLGKEDILGRYGGEEFIIIFKNSNKHESLIVINEILNIIRSKTFIYDNNFIKFTFSAGIASCNEFSKDEITIDTLIGVADKRMYKAKNSGRNKIMIESI